MTPPRTGWLGGLTVCALSVAGLTLAGCSTSASPTPAGPGSQTGPAASASSGTGSAGKGSGSSGKGSSGKGSSGKGSSGKGSSGKGSSGKGSSTSGSAGEGSSSGSAGEGSSSSGSKSPPARIESLSQFAAQVESAVGLTFKATYWANGPGAALTYAQSGTRSAFSAGSTTFYGGAGAGTVCDASSGTPVCSPGAAPLEGVLSLVSPAKALAAMEAAESAREQIKQSAPSHAVQCLAYNFDSQPVSYCISGQGVVSSITTPNGTFKMVSFTTAVSDADVSAPTT